MIKQRLIVAGLIHQDPVIHQQILKQHPQIARLFKKYQAEPQAVMSSEQLLGTFFGMTADTAALSSASICHFAEFKQATDHYWFHFDPVHLKADRDQLLIFDGAYLNIQIAEAQQLIDECCAFYADLNWKIQFKTAHRWYLGLSQAAKINTTTIQMVTGKSIGDFLPTGEDSAAWRNILNEIQMLFFQSTINQQRQPMINGVWISAGGQLPKITGEISQIWSSSLNLFVEGIAALVNTTVITDLSQLEFKSNQPIILSYQEIEQAALTGEHQAWLDAIAGFEQWLKKYQSLIQPFDLYPLNGYYYRPKKTLWQKIFRG